MADDSDGIEVHFDEDRGVLELSCEPGAFAPYLDLIRSQLTDLPGIPLNKFIEIQITDTEVPASERDDGFTGIEVRCNERSGYLELICEPSSFEPFRKLAQSQIGDTPEIPFNDVVEIDLTDVAGLLRCDSARPEPNTFVAAVCWIVLALLVSFFAWLVKH